MWALDANVRPEAWDSFFLGDVTWLEKIGCEIIVVSNSLFTCRSGTNSFGGSMIDYIIISKPGIALVLNLTAAFNAPWGPHFGLALTLNAKVDEILCGFWFNQRCRQTSWRFLKADAIETKKGSRHSKQDRSH